MNHLEALNQAFFLSINASLASPAWEISLAAVMADYLIYLIPVALVGLWCWRDETQRNLALKACLVAFVALGVNQIIIQVWPHPRPFMIGLGHMFIPHAPDSSFPSDHATIFFAVGLTLILGYLRSVTGWAILVLGALVAWARIFLGVHFPLDMLGALGVVCVVWMGITMGWARIGTMVTRQMERFYRVIFARPIALGLIRP
ncbi:MAG: phosphatase PAP2 family protein [Rhodoferax sp.]|uniref:phosphatase PAP2 family protein n=1 Tax=Rhodoferax sp. TaxID=50421 RepID=UPI0017CA95E7|nr:phosphatase PAP2 family protein [Rhodoferax sp.]NMM13877.1 phosphatase PAP2 family protein [Rhodoferax sp.]